MSLQDDADERRKARARELIDAGALTDSASIDQFMRTGKEPSKLGGPTPPKTRQVATRTGMKTMAVEEEDPNAADVNPLHIAGMKTYARGLGQAVLPVGDEIAAAGRAAFGGENYSDALADERAEIQHIRDSRPGLIGGMEIAGALIPATGAAKLLKGASKMSKLGRVARVAGQLEKAGPIAKAVGTAAAGAGAGAGAGATYGFLGSDGEGVAERASDAVIPAVIGGAAGGLIGPAAGAVRGMIGKFGREAGEVAPKATSPIGKATEWVTGKATQSNRDMADHRVIELLRRDGVALEDLGKMLRPDTPEMLLDVGRGPTMEASNIARRSGSGRDLVRDRVRTRADAAPQRAGEALDAAGLVDEGAPSGRDLMRGKVDPDRTNELYDLGRRKGTALPKEARAALAKVAPTDGFGAALEIVLENRNLTRPRGSQIKLSRYFDEDGVLKAGAPLDAKTLLEVRQVMDDFIAGANGYNGKAGRAFERNATRATRDQWKGLRGKVDNALKAVPEIAEADTRASSSIRGRNAFERARGKETGAPSFSNEKDMYGFRNFFGGLDDAGKDAYRQGARRQYGEQLGEMRPSTRGSVPDPFRTEFGTPNAEARFREVLPGDKVDDLMDRTGRETKMADRSRTILGGSDTYENLAQGEESAQSLERIMGFKSLFTGGIDGIKNLAGHAGDLAAGRTSQVRAALGDVLTMSGPELEQYLARLPERERELTVKALRNRVGGGALAGQLGARAQERP